MSGKSTGTNNPRIMTKKEIALACGVSRITLDRVLSNKPGVGKETRAQILAFLQKNGYRENRLAQSLVRGRSRSFGIIVFDLNNSFYAQLVNAFQRAAQEAGYVSYIMLSNKNPQHEKSLLEDLLARQVEGILLNSAVKEPDYGAYLLGQGTPILSVMNQIAQDMPFLGFDEHVSMRELVRFALGQGYRRFLYVCPPLARAMTSNMDSLLRRKQGFDEELAACPEAEATILGDSGYLEALLKYDYNRGPRPCILCTSDVYAVEIHQMLMKIGLEAPKDYAIAGYDNIPLLHAFQPRLTTVSLHIGELGAKAAQLLIRAASGEPLPKKVLMPHTLLKMDTL